MLKISLVAYPKINELIELQGYEHVEEDKDYAQLRDD